MPIFFQQHIDQNTKLAIWKIEEEEGFFLQHVPLQRDITHPHKRLQHLAGRYLLQFLFPDFPINLIKIADTRKPFLENEAYHFSISHCGDFAAALVSKTARVGIDIEVPTPKIERIRHKFLNEAEGEMADSHWGIAEAARNQLLNEAEKDLLLSSVNGKLTLLWSCKEAMFKWWGFGDVEFKTVLNIHQNLTKNGMELTGHFNKGGLNIVYPVHWKTFAGLLLAWVVTEPDIIKIID